MADWTLTPFQRFTAKVVTGPGCWEWRGTVGNNGYGRFMIRRKTVTVHRYSYITMKGPIPQGLQIDHLCRNRKCVRPSHLEAVPPRTNVLRGVGIMAQKARQTHCIHGHEFTPENTAHYKGRRCCRQCARNNVQRVNAACTTPGIRRCSCGKPKGFYATRCWDCYRNWKTDLAARSQRLEDKPLSPEGVVLDSPQTTHSSEAK